MATREHTSLPRERANSLPENTCTIRKVTIQQRVVQSASTAIAVTEYSDKARRYPKVEYHDPSGRGRRGKQPVKPTRGVIIKNVNGLELKAGERKNLETTSRTGERELWEKAVKELELVIEEKDIAIEKLSKVNRKLSGDLQWYERTLEDCRGDLNDLKSKLMEAERKIKDQEWYRRILKEREEKIRDLGGRLNEMTRLSEMNDKRSLQLSQGAKRVLTKLELTKEKSELKRKVEELEKQLNNRTTEVTSRHQLPGLRVNKSAETDTFHKISSNLRNFQLTLEKALGAKLHKVTEFQERLSQCVLKCEILSKNAGEASRVPKVTCAQEPILQESSLPELTVGTTNPGKTDLVDLTHGVSNPQVVNQQERTPGVLNAENMTQQGMIFNSDDENLPEGNLVEQLSYLQEALVREKQINDEIIERYLELEEANKGFQETMEALRSKASLNENLRTENERYIREILELKETLAERAESRSQDMRDGTHEEERIGAARDKMVMYEEKVKVLQAVLESQENEMKELREKVNEDDELIEELRANFQREEKWNQEIQRKYEWELSSSANKDKCIEEFQDCLWEREKAVRQLREQLEFEDKRCEELLEKLVASQKEAQELEEMALNFQKKLEDKEKRIQEFCEQNDKDAVAIGNLTSENKQLQKEIANLTKVRKGLEEHVESLTACLETVEKQQETFVMRQRNDVNKLSIQLREEEHTSKGKDEVIEKLQENVVLLSADVTEMEIQMEEERRVLEEELKKTKGTIEQREKEVTEASERYEELEEVCTSLREKIFEKDEQIVEREAEIAAQREAIETGEKQIEELREKCGDTSLHLNDKPALAYTEAEMDEANELLEQERNISEMLRTQIQSLENEVLYSKNSLLETKEKLEKENEAMAVLVTTQKELEERNNLLEKTREELHARNNLLEKTRAELHVINIEQLKLKGTLIAREKELEEYRGNLQVLQVKLNNMDKDKQVLEVRVRDNDSRLTSAKRQAETLIQENEGLKNEIDRKEEQLKMNEGEIEELKNKVETLTALCSENEEELTSTRVNNVNLRYSLEEYVSQSRDQIQNLRNHEKEVETLRNHIFEMNILVNGFRGALEQAVEKERMDEDHITTNETENCLTSEDNRELPKVLSGFSGSTVDTQGPSATNGGSNDTVSPVNYQNLEDRESPHPYPRQHADSDFHDNIITTDNQPEAKASKPDITLVSGQSQHSFFDNLYQKLAALIISKNRGFLSILGLLLFVFVLGCMNNSIVSRKYLFVFANSIISLTIFVLWRDEVRRNKLFRAFSGTRVLREHDKFQDNGEILNNGDLFSKVVSECQHCGNVLSAHKEELLRFGKIKSSFQELHEKFLEAVENSSKNTLPIQELYNEYEKLKNEVDVMRKDRLDNESMPPPTLEEEQSSEKVNFLKLKWTQVGLILGRILIILVLSEMLYNRGTYLPQVARLFTFLFSSFAFSYVFEMICANSSCVETQAGQNEMEVGREIDELNEIIDKEHELVTTQREAIKALEKRLRKEFEKRIKQRNVLLKKLKFKGKLEDLQDLLDDDRNNEYERHDRHKTDKDPSKMVPANDRLKRVQDIFTKSEQQSVVLDLTFSPMFFFLGVPLTGIMLSCRYFLLGALMSLTQVIVFLKESKYIEVDKFPEVLQKQVNPILLDTAVVFYACLLAVCLQCSQGIAVLITCCVVQLSVHWWTSYRLAKRDDTLYEISHSCFPSCEEDS